MSLRHFLSYHNAVPVAFSILILGGTGVFAATNPEILYSETQRVVSVDNTYIVGKDLASFSPRAEIVSVTEDDENYYVSYLFYTIDLEDYAWKDVAKQNTMKVSKAALGPYRDLGVYVTGQLRENIEQEARRLSETQEIERRSVTQKVVATEYGGLVGKMLDTTTETLPGYMPVVVPPPDSQVAAAAVQDQPAGSGENSGQSAPVSAPQSGAPIIQILGANPANITVGSSYVDLGAVITGPTDADRNLGLRIFVNGSEMAVPTIDTSVAGNWLIRYQVLNAAGRESSAERVVMVIAPEAPIVPAPENPTPPQAEESGAQSESASSTPSEGSTSSTTPQ